MTEQAASFQKSVVKGIAWTSLGLLLIRLFFFITSIITARLLTPDDFGIIGMAATITLLIDTTSANGIDNFIIYRQDLQHRETNTAFVMNAGIALLLAFLLAAAGPLFAAFYHQPKLNGFLVYAGLAFLAAMLGRIPRAFLIKEMRQNVLSLIDIVSNFVNFALIIGLALQGAQYLSYVLALLVSQTVRTILLHACCGKRFQVQLDSAAVKAIVAYGKNYLPQTMLSYCLTQADYIIGGLLLSSTLLGYYYFGFEKAFLVVMLVRSMAVQVFFPLFSRCQSDRLELRARYFSLSGYSMFLLFPVLFFMLICSREIVSLLYGLQWQQSLFTFQCLLGYTFLSVTYDLSVILLNAVGKSEQNLRHFALVLPVAVPVFYLGALYGGLHGLTLAAMLVHSASAVLMMFRLQNCYQWSVREQGLHLLKFAAPLLIQLPVLLSLQSFLSRQQATDACLILMMAVVFAVLYLALSRILNPAVLQGCIGFFLQKIKTRKDGGNAIAGAGLTGVKA